MRSAYFTSSQLRAIEKTGDILIPGDDEMPSFKKLGCIEYVDRVAEYMAPQDLQDFRGLMSVFARLPGFLIRGIMSLTRISFSLPSLIGGNLRMLELGVKGVVMTLYYSDLRGPDYQGKSVHELIGYDAHIVTHLN